MTKKYFNKIKDLFNDNIKKIKAYFYKLKNQIKIIWSDPLQRYIFIFLIAFLISLMLFFVLWRRGAKYDFIEKGKISRIIDGDTFVLNGRTIVLYGIDAPELKQKCGYYNIHTKKDSFYNCGDSAKKFLKRITRGRDIECKIKDKDKYERFISICYVDDLDINGKMVFRGYAVAYKKYSRKYIREENNAKRNKMGIWGGEFIRPSEFRKNSNK
jgi:endonuclease YncB( thermonuclease family)